MINSLPTEILGHIFSYLDVSSLGKASGTCKKWSTILDDNYLWKTLYKNNFNKKLPGKPSRNWKRTYQKSHSLDLLLKRSQVFSYFHELEFLPFLYSQSNVKAFYRQFVSKLPAFIENPDYKIMDCNFKRVAAVNEVKNKIAIFSRKKLIAEMDIPCDARESNYKIKNVFILDKEHLGFSATVHNYSTNRLEQLNYLTSFGEEKSITRLDEKHIVIMSNQFRGAFAYKYDHSLKVFDLIAFKKSKRVSFDVNFDPETEIIKKFRKKFGVWNKHTKILTIYDRSSTSKIIDLKNYPGYLHTDEGIIFFQISPEKNTIQLDIYDINKDKIVYTLLLENNVNLILMKMIYEKGCLFIPEKDKILMFNTNLPPSARPQKRFITPWNFTNQLEKLYFEKNQLIAENTNGKICAWRLDRHERETGEVFAEYATNIPLHLFLKRVVIENNKV